MSSKSGKSKKIKKRSKKKINQIKRGYDLFRSDFSKRLKIEDPEKYNQIC